MTAMRPVKITLFFLLFPIALFAQQVQVTEGTAKMGKKKLWSFMATYNFNKNQTLEVLEGDVKTANLKHASKKKGFKIYKGATWTTITPNKSDYYYKVKEKHGKTTLYFVVSKGYENYVTTTNDATMAASITSYLQNLDGRITTNEQIKLKQGELAKIEAEKKANEAALEASQKQQKLKTQEIKTLKATK